ncbi:MAG: biopolymer transporter ExbD [Marinifilaceae bacterium]|nr:biopolymer transporter ExbD [Marinifilaceae bacterium]
MATFRKGGTKEVPAISTASLPDIVFMLLFFFMVSTTIREVSVMVDNGMPEARTATKLEKKSLVSNIYVGKPKEQYIGTYGSEPRIQLNDKFANLNEITSFVIAEQEARSEEDRNKITNNLKVDMFTKMGIITDLKQELRRANSLRVSYATRKKV